MCENLCVCGKTEQERGEGRGEREGEREIVRGEGRKGVSKLHAVI